MHCYLCSSELFTTRKGEVRDNPTLRIKECISCGLVTLEDHSHIKSDFYKNSGMHASDLPSIDYWLKETQSDDRRRLEMIRPMLTNANLLDFGCGAGGFLNLAKNLARNVTGIELGRLWKSQAV